MNELVVLLEGREAGRVHRRGDRLQFTYNEDWRRDPDAYPLSLSMPRAARSHPHGPISAFIWGLLPDNDRTLERWAREFQVSARNGFALIGNVGEDCAGAVQFVRPERLEQVEQGGDIDWIDEDEVAARLRSVLADAASGRTARDNGQFSLAGAQPKTAFLRWRGRWGIPSGRIPTTHILKPASAALPGHAENEHLCLRLANALGLRTVRSEVLSFAGSPVICVKRYDRYSLSGDRPEIVRLHQEDMCQALAVHPERKYQNEGGPGATDIVNLIRISVGAPGRGGGSTDAAIMEDSWSFIDALIFNWLIGGTDAHAKNYSFLLGGGGLVRLAPFYDIASAFGFEHIAPQRMKLAMKIGRHYRLNNIVLRHWIEWGRETKIDATALLERITRLAERLPDAVLTVAREMNEQGLDHPIIARLVDGLTKRAQKVPHM